MDTRTAYANIERIIIYGFLTVAVDLYGTRLVFKNITDRETENTKFFVPDGVRDDLAYKIWLSTFSINELCLLRDRKGYCRDMVSFYNTIPVGVVSKIIAVVQELNERYIASLKFLEGFCYTRDSRNLWKVWGTGGRDLSGFPDLQKVVGINSVQENWIIINKQLDSEDQYDKDFNLSVMVASAFNSKGSKSISRTYESGKKELKELREEIAKHGYEAKRVKEQTVQEQWTAPLKSREDLVRELYRQMSGKKDRHDLFIDRWIEDQKKQAEEAKNAVEDKQKAFRKKIEDSDESLLEPSRSISSKDIVKIKDPNSNEYMSNYDHIGKQDHFIKKISSRVMRATVEES